MNNSSKGYADVDPDIETEFGRDREFVPEASMIKREESVLHQRKIHAQCAFFHTVFEAEMRDMISERYIHKGLPDPYSEAKERRRAMEAGEIQEEKPESLPGVLDLSAIKCLETSYYITGEKERFARKVEKNIKKKNLNGLL